MKEEAMKTMGTFDKKFKSLEEKKKKYKKYNNRTTTDEQPS